MIRDRFDSLQVLVKVADSLAAMRADLADLTAAAYLDGAADAALEDEHGNLLDRDRTERATQRGVAAGATVAAVLLDAQRDAVTLAAASAWTFEELSALLTRHGIAVDQGLAQLGAPGLDALFRASPAPTLQPVQGA